MSDDVVFQRGAPIPENENSSNGSADSSAPAGENHEMTSPKIFDFSSDLNISPVGEDTGSETPPNKGPITGKIIRVRQATIEKPPRSKPAQEIAPVNFENKPIENKGIKRTAPNVPPPEPKNTSDFETNFTPPPQAIYSPPKSTTAFTPPAYTPPVTAFKPPASYTPSPKPASGFKPPETYTPPKVYTRPIPSTPPKVQVINTVKTPSLNKLGPDESAVSSKADTNVASDSNVPSNLPGATSENIWPTVGQTGSKEKNIEKVRESAPPAVDISATTFAEEIKKASPVSAEPVRSAPIVQTEPFKAVTRESQMSTWKPAAPQPTPVPDKVDIKNVRTYESDIADALSHRGTSRVAMSLAESKRRGEGETIRNKPEPETPVAKIREAVMEPEPYSPSHSGKKIFIVIISLFLIGIGSIVGYFLYSKSPLSPQKTPKNAQSRTLPSIIPSDLQTVIKTESMDTAELEQAIKNAVTKNEKEGLIKEILFTQVRDGTEYRVSALEMAALLNIPVPDIIARTLEPQWMLGALTDTLGTHAFVAVNTNLFQNAFAGMLEWENTILEDIDQFVTSPDAGGAVFKDKIVRNKDVRAFVTPKGQTLFLYSFIDNSTLIFTDSETTLSQILTRLESKAFVR